jgi:hypothetical protein
MRILRFAVIILAVVCLPLLAHTAEIQMTSSTQYSWYQDFLSNDEDQNEIVEYLRLNATKLDKEGKLSIYGYGRVIYQFSDSVEERPEIANDTFGRMYYLYLDYRDAIKDHLDLRAGRTYVSAAAVSGTVDGAYLDLKNLGPLGVTAFGGRRVIFDNKSEIGTSGDSLWGGSVYFDTVKFTHIEASYGRKYAEDDLATENIGLDFSTTPHEKINVYGRMKYDIVSSRFNEVLLGAKVAPVKDLVLRGEYYYSYATFDKSSFYRFFNINNYKEIGIAAEYQLSADYRIYAKYANEDFGGDETANLYDLGIFAHPIKDLTLDASYEYRQGFTGRLNGIRFHGAYRIYRATILAGIDYDDFRREDSREGTAKKYWAGLNYEITKMFGAVLRLEDNKNFLFDDSFQGFVALNINL